MATKWKNCIRSVWCRAIAWLLIIGMSAVMSWEAAVFVAYLADGENVLLDEDMLWSKDISARCAAAELYQAAEQMSMQAQCGTEESIRAGEQLTEEMICQRLFDYFWLEYDSETAEYITLYPKTEDSALNLTDETIQALSVLARKMELTENSADQLAFRNWLKYNRGAYEAARQELIQEQWDTLRVYEKQKPYDKTMDYYVYEKDTGVTITNLNVKDASEAEKLLKETPTWYSMILRADAEGTTFQSNQWSAEQCAALEQYDNIENYTDHSFSEKDVILVAIKSEAVALMQQSWTQTREQLCTLLTIEILGGILILLCIFLLCCAAGRKQEDDSVHLTGIDAVWTEVQITIYGCILAGWIFVLEEISWNWKFIDPLMRNEIIAITTVLFIVVTLVMFFSQIRRIKAKKWLDGWICIRLFRKYVVRWIKKLFVWLYTKWKTIWLRKVIFLHIGVLAVVYCVGVSIGCAVTRSAVGGVILGFVLISCLEAKLDHQSVEWMEKLAHAAKEIRAGNLDTHITLENAGKEMQAFAEDLNGISDGMKTAVETAVRSERLRTELLSNVSHDIKTPLTGVITYIDLLKQCDLQEENAREYLAVLEQKAQRLKILIGDLFDASKASSGAMNVEIECLDFDALLHQELGEQAERLEQAHLELRIQSEQGMYVAADGRLLWRILDNLISNCIRYARKDSRVYLRMTQDQEYVTLVIKNISAEELNISADELMERFTRGDRARHTEGSGLGLSIARSLAELMHGTCEVSIDGDLFKATVRIPRWRDNNA